MRPASLLRHALALALGRALALALALFSLAGCVGGSDSPSEKAASRLDAVIGEVRKSHPWVPGLTVNVRADAGANGYALDWVGATGHSDLATRTPMGPHDRYVLASVTKTYVAATVLALEDAGFLSTDDRIDAHLGETTLAVLRAGGYEPSSITLDMLLAHTAGLRDYVSFEYFGAVLADPAHRWTPAEQIQLAMDLGLPLSAPGTAYHYVDTGYVLLGEIVQRATGLPLPEAVRARLDFAALGLQASTWQAGDPVAPVGAGPLSHPYISLGDIRQLDFLSLDPSVDLFGGGGLVASAHDAAEFIRALVSGKVLRAHSLATMQKLGPGGDDPGISGRYARGLTRFDIDGAQCWGHIGGWGAMSAHCPEIGISFAFSYNSNGDPDGQDDFDQLALARLLVAAARPQ